ncbi:hypothetical protein PMIN07_008909 [Paraphaeosphaeria minitans]
MTGAPGGGRGRAKGAVKQPKDRFTVPAGSGPSRAAGRQPLSPPSSKDSKEQRHESGCEWLARVWHDAKEFDYIAGNPTPLAQDMISYEEEDNQPAPKSAKALGRLKMRFLSYLALAFGDNGAWDAPTIGLLHEDTENSVATIRLARLSTKDECLELSDAARRFAQAFARIHDAHAQGYSTDSRDLEEVVFRLYQKRTLQLRSNLHDLWRSNQEKFHEIIADMSGIWDEDGRVARDEAIGDAIITINGLVSLQSMDPNDHEASLIALILASLELLNIEGGMIQQRLKNVLGSSLAVEVYDNAAKLIQPIKSVQTFVRTAHALREFDTIKFLRGDASADGGSSQSTSGPVRSPASSSSSPSSSLSNHMSTNDNASSVSPNSSSADHEATIATIPPAIRSAAVELAACVLENRIPDSHTEGYYLFGFPACNNDDETQQLGWLYKAMLLNAQSQATVLADICQALNKNQLAQSFDRNGWASFRSELPYLEGFLTAPLLERPTVFRLVQFLRCMDDSNPPPVLIRDWGFHNCRQREEVEILKDIYQRSLEKLSIFQLHHACVSNTLLATVRGARIHFEHNHARFLSNQGPLPGLGYQKISSPFMFDQGLFKHEKTKRMRMSLH